MQIFFTENEKVSVELNPLLNPYLLAPPILVSFLEELGKKELTETSQK